MENIHSFANPMGKELAEVLAVQSLSTAEEPFSQFWFEPTRREAEQN
jgi:hypothetical protein